MIRKMIELLHEGKMNCKECPINIKAKKQGFLPCANYTCLYVNGRRENNENSRRN